MALLNLSSIEKHFGARVIFDHLDFAIERGERVGLIGDNGSGKSTLFRVILGDMPIDAGNVSLARSARVGYLSQDPALDNDNSVMDEAELALSELHELSHRMRELEHEMGEAGGAELDKVLAKYQKTQHDFEAAGGYAWRHRVEGALLGVGLPAEMWEQKVATLSGGQRARLALAKLLAGSHDLLLLDEPTNHLDLSAIAFLESFLADFSGAVLIVSHDRYLLDRLANRIAWLRAAKIANFPGNYSAFVKQRALHELTQARDYEKQQADIAKQSEYIRRFSAGQRARQAQGRKKRLERLLQSDAMISEVARDQKIRLSMGSDERGIARAGDRVLSVKDLSKSYDGRTLWRDVEFEIERGQRWGIIGPNGSGKTTLLETLLGRRDADGGVVRWGKNLEIGYYDQHLGDFDPENTVAEEVRGEREMSEKELRGLLARLLFFDEDLDKPIHLLSGGERARVAMAQLLADKPNVLILDEPTNHLDVNSCEALERAMGEFAGTILCVSHDRYFLDRIAGKLLILQPPTARVFDGNYTAWSQIQTKASEPEPVKKKHSTPPRPPAKKSSDNPWTRPHGRLTVEQLELRISETETELAECQNIFADAGSAKDAERSRATRDKFEKLSKLLQELEQEYFLRGEQ